MKIDNNTKIVCSIASKQGALGPAMHNSAYKYLELNFVYLALTVNDLKNAINGIKALHFQGSAVSMPHKQKIMKYLDKVDGVAKKIGAVNTVLNNDGKLIGYNSDWIGAVSALKEKTNLKNKKVVLIGAGGVARAIAYGLKLNKAKIYIFNRNKNKAKLLAKEFNLSFGGNIQDIKNIKDYDILINATSVGFIDPKQSIVNSEIIKPNKIIMDVVFNQKNTELLKIAKIKKCKVIPGYRMLIYQALFQFKLFTGKEASFNVMEKELLKLLK